MESKLVTVRELAAHLAVSESWLYQQVEHGRIPHYRIGRAVRFDPAAITEWLASEAYRAPAEN